MPMPLHEPSPHVLAESWLSAAVVEHFFFFFKKVQCCPQTLEIQIKELAQNKRMSCLWVSIDLSLPVCWTAHTDAPVSHHPRRRVWELWEKRFRLCTHGHISVHTHTHTDMAGCIYLHLHLGFYKQEWVGEDGWGAASNRRKACKIERQNDSRHFKRRLHFEYDIRLQAREQWCKLRWMTWEEKCVCVWHTTYRTSM